LHQLLEIVTLLLTYLDSNHNLLLIDTEFALLFFLGFCDVSPWMELPDNVDVCL